MAFQGPYFHYFGFIHAKNVNFLIFAGIGSGLHSWQILIFIYAYALIFIHRHFGSLFWLLWVPIGSLFHRKMGPYLKAWGFLLVLETVSMTLLFLEQLELEDARRVAADDGADSESSLGCRCPARAKSQACLSCTNSLRGFHKAPCLTCCRHQGQQP